MPIFVDTFEKKFSTPLKAQALLIRVAYIFLFCCTVQLGSAQLYKDLMHDHTVNFYTAVQEAEAYFANKPKGKGSGWKGYQRWRAANEYKYYPDGDRTKVDPYFVSKSFQDFKENNPPTKSLFNGSWEDLGPYYIEQVTGHYAVGLGRVESFYVDPSNESRLYIGSRSGGFWKSENGGASWSGSTSEFLIASGVNTLAVSIDNSDDIMINVRNARNGTTHGIYKSTDAGDNWTESNFNPTNLGWGGLGSNRQIYIIAYHPTISDVVFVGTNNGLYRSDDNLDTWTQLLSSSDIYDIAFHPTDASVMYVRDNVTANKNHVLVSTDQGLTFSNSATLSGNNNASYYLQTSVDCPDCLFVSSTNGIWKSDNQGTSFSFISNPPNSCWGGFAVSDIDINNMLYGGIDAYFSTDEGVNFNQVTYWSQGNANYDQTGTYIHADLRGAECFNGVFYVITDGFLCRSIDNGSTWEILSEGVGIRENYNLGLSQSNHYRTICGSQDNGTSIKTQATWIEFYGADGMEGIIHPSNDDWMIGSLQYGGRRRTLDGGISQNGVTPPNQSGNWIAPLFYDPNNQMSVYSLGENIHKSEDFGTSWSQLGSPGFTGQITFASIAENNSNIIVVARNQDIELSIDGGISFTDIQGSLPGYSITDIAFDPNDDNVIVVTYGRYQNDNSKVYMTANLGESWQNITYNLNNMPVRSVVIDHTDASNIYLGTEIGIYHKAMSSNSWALYNSDLPNVSVPDLEVMYGSNTIRAATWGRGLWEYTLVGRTDFPAILSTEITNPPTENAPKEGTDQYVTSVITCDNPITNVYVAWSENNPTFGNIINMSNTSGNTWISDAPFPVTDLGAKIFYKVIAESNTGDISETYKFMYRITAFDYCAAQGSSGTGADYIDFVSLNGVETTSGQDYYGDFTTTEINLETGGTYTLQVDLNYHWDPDTTGAWIDYNYDAEFSANEFIELSELNGSHESFGDFTVPYSAVLDKNLRMRVRSTYWNNPPLPCGTLTGEVEDYTIIVSASALPIQLLSFTATLELNEVKLHWETSSEANNAWFVVEVSRGLISWEEVSKHAGAGTSIQHHYYNAIDEKPLNGQSYYRLKQVDFDGNYSYSNIESIYNGSSSAYHIFPNPTNKSLFIEGDNLLTSTITLQNISGQIFSAKYVQKSSQSYFIDVSEFPAGLYFLKISNRGDQFTYKLLVQD